MSAHAQGVGDMTRRRVKRGYEAQVWGKLELLVGVDVRERRGGGV